MGVFGGDEGEEFVDGAGWAGEGGEEGGFLLRGGDDPGAGAAEGLLVFENEGDGTVGDGGEDFGGLGGEPFVAGACAGWGDGGEVVGGEGDLGLCCAGGAAFGGGVAVALDVDCLGAWGGKAGVGEGCFAVEVPVG